MDAPLRLIAANPLDQLAKTIEALLVVASAPLTAAELAEAAGDDVERVEAALGLVGERYREGRSGVVLEHVAGGWAFRASREAAEACARLFEKPAQRGLSQAALETLAIVAYLGPCTRPDVARIRGRLGRLGGGEPGRAWADLGGGAGRGGGRRDPLPHDATVRACLRARVALPAPAPGRPRRGRGSNPQSPPRCGRKAHGLKGRGQAPLRRSHGFSTYARSRATAISRGQSKQPSTGAAFTNECGSCRPIVPA
jgi:hypothetical protein